MEERWTTSALPFPRRDDHMIDAGGENPVCIRVLIADDQPRARRSLKALLTAMRWSTPSNTGQPAHAAFFPVEIVGEAENGQQAVEQAWALQPDVVVMDLHPHAGASPESQSDGWAAIGIIKSRWPAIRIVVLTMYATDRAPVLEAGADAFLLKGCPTSELLDAVMLGWL
jgi:DNA-binding NarL/FixJ family response regulator